MIPAATALAQTAAAPKLRAGFFYIPHGAIMDNTPYGKEVDAWTPSGAGADFKLSPIMKPLEKYKQLRHVLREPREHGERRTRCTRSCRPPGCRGVRPDSSGHGRQHGDDARPGDRRARSARRPRCPRSRSRPRPRSQVAACGRRRLLLQHDAVVPQRDTPLPMEFNPRKVFMQLFGEGDTPAERDAICAPDTPASST